MIFNFLCNRTWMAIDVPLQIWAAQTADGAGGSVAMTRFLHNKLLFWANNYLRCHLTYLGPDFIFKNFSLLGLVLFIFGIWHLVKSQKLRWLLIILSLLPALVVLQIPFWPVLPGILLYGFYLGIMLLGLHELWELSRRQYFRLRQRSNP